MLGRFLHFYPGYTARSALDEPWSRFLALTNAISEIEASEDLRALMIAGMGANPGENGESFSNYSEELRIRANGGRAERSNAGSKSIATDFDPSFPFYEVETIPGSVNDLRQQMILAAREAERVRHGFSS